MASQILLLLSVLAIASCNDLRSGFTDSRQRLIFEQKYEYSPSIYTRSETVTVTAVGNEIISQIDVTDLRELKDGTATLTRGGVGQKAVTIELSGPAVFRGMYFVVKVYAVDSNYFYYGNRNAGNQRLGTANVNQRVGDYSGYPSNAYNGNQRSGEYNNGYPTSGYPSLKTGSYVYDQQQQQVYNDNLRSVKQ